MSLPINCRKEARTDHQKLPWAHQGFFLIFFAIDGGLYQGSLIGALQKLESCA